MQTNVEEEVKERPSYIFLTAQRHLGECLLCQRHLCSPIPRISPVQTCIRRDQRLTPFRQCMVTRHNQKLLTTQIREAITLWLREHPEIHVEHGGQSYRFRDRARASLFLVEQGWET